MWPFNRKSPLSDPVAQQTTETQDLTPTHVDVSKVDWPTGEDTGDLFDLAWLDNGTRKQVDDAGEAVIARALTSPDPDGVLSASGVQPSVRTEYQRRRAIALFGTNFLHQPEPVLRAGDVRGVFYLEWGYHIDHLKRTGHLEEALALTYQVIEAAERVDALERQQYGAAGWYRRAAIILRKLGDYEAEIRLIEDVLERYPGYSELSDRLPTSRRLLAKQHAG